MEKIVRVYMHASLEVLGKTTLVAGVIGLRQNLILSPRFQYAATDGGNHFEWHIDNTIGRIMFKFFQPTGALKKLAAFDKRPSLINRKMHTSETEIAITNSIISFPLVVNIIKSDWCEYNE